MRCRGKVWAVGCAVDRYRNLQRATILGSHRDINHTSRDGRRVGNYFLIVGHKAVDVAAIKNGTHWSPHWYW